MSTIGAGRRGPPSPVAPDAPRPITALESPALPTRTARSLLSYTTTVADAPLSEASTPFSAHTPVCSAWKQPAIASASPDAFSLPTPQPSTAAAHASATALPSSPWPSKSATTWTPPLSERCTASWLSSSSAPEPGSVRVATCVVATALSRSAGFFGAAGGAAFAAGAGLGFGLLEEPPMASGGAAVDDPHPVFATQQRPGAPRSGELATILQAVVDLRRELLAVLLAVNKLTRPANPRASDAMATEVCTEDLVDMDEDVDMEEQARNRGTPVDMVTAAVVGLACGYFMVQLLTLIWFRRERAFRPKQPHILVPQLLAAMVFSIMLLVVNGHFFRGSGWLSYCQLWDVWGFWISLSAWLNSQALRVVKVHQVRVLELEENLSAAIGKANSARGARRHWLWKKARPPLHNLRAAF